MAKKPVRIKDIAKAAGVSIGTVDRVLHNRGNVSEDALKRVNEVLDKNEYHPNLIARSLGSKRDYKIAALLPNHLNDDYWGLAYQGIELAKPEWLHYSVHIVAYEFDPDLASSFQEASSKALKSKPDGVLIAPILYNETFPFFKNLADKAIPFVLFNTNIIESNALSFIG